MQGISRLVTIHAERTWNVLELINFYLRNMANLNLFDPTRNELIDWFYRRVFSPRDLQMRLDNHGIRLDVSATTGGCKAESHVGRVKKKDLRIRANYESSQNDSTPNTEKEHNDKSARLIRVGRDRAKFSRVFSLALDARVPKFSAKFDAREHTHEFAKKTAADAKVRRALGEVR